MRDSHVIVGHIVPAGERPIATFQIRPWGVRSSMTLRFDDVARASPLRHMFWDQQRSISTAQVAGVFARSVPSRRRHRNQVAS
jgi:hypothetical protein